MRRVFPFALSVTLFACSSTHHDDAAAAAPTVDTGSAPDASDASSDALDVTVNDYGVDGPFTWTKRADHFDGPAGHTVNVTSYLPDTPNPAPVVSFSCGSAQKAAGYAPYGERLASWGIAMVIRDDPGVPVNTVDVVKDAVAVVETWMPTALAGKVDASRLGVAGHSRGGAVTFLSAEHELKGMVKAAFGLDAVDDEFLMAPGAYARADLPQIAIPTGWIGASVTGTCAPPNDGYQVLYPLAPSPSVLVVAVDADHTDVEVQSACAACNVCTPFGSADPDVVLAYSVRYTTAFFARELLGDAAVGAAFEGAGAGDDVKAGRVTIASK